MEQFKFIFASIILRKYSRGDMYLSVSNFNDCLGIPDSEYENFARYLKEKHIYITSKFRIKLEGNYIKTEHYDVLIDWNHDLKAKKCLEELEMKLNG